MDERKQAALAAIEEKSELFYQLSDDIWDHPELGFRETYAARRQTETLRALGFEVQEGLGGIPTAFSGRWGHGKPVVAFMGEFDALSGLSQQADTALCRPVQEGAPGHGCGHNLLGAGCIAAAYGIKEYLRATGKEGTVIYYGCPAEENGSGKTFMARQGVFDELDCAFYWHPGASCKFGVSTSLANFAVKYRFTGVSSHAAAAPERGRSALDAAALMNLGVQYLREHVSQDVRIHCALTDTGGISPNVVQAHAEVSYLIRAPKVSQARALYERVNKIAQGAALMTETEVEIKFVKACSEELLNLALTEVGQENLESIPMPEITQEELDCAKAIRATYADDERDPLCRVAAPLDRTVKQGHGSCDVGDVSKLCPTIYLHTPTWAVGTAAHSWQATAQGKSGYAHKAMLFAGTVLAATGIDLAADPEKLAPARAEFEQRSAEQGGYECPIPADVPVPQD